MNYLNSNVGISLATLMTLAASAHALPPIWETQTGGAINELNDDEESERIRIALPFQFEYDGSTYDAMWVYVGGVVTLGTEQELPSAPDPDDLPDLAQPALAPFWSDIETNDGGAVRYNSFSDRVVVTWDGVRADSAEDVPYTFQLQMHADGIITFGYSGNLPLGDDYLNADLIVGISDASGGTSTRFASDIPFQTNNTTIYEFFPEESPFAFPLAESNLVFVPLAEGGFEVSDSIPDDDCVVDLAEPFGTVDFFDASTFIALYAKGDESVDYAEPFGELDFFDVSEFLNLYAIGCP